MKLKCPICGKQLKEEEHAYLCVNAHSFDKSKEGYVNLLRKQKKKEYGDSVAQVEARRAFFSHDFYRPLKEEVAEVIREYKLSSLVDAGCGEGYYTNYFRRVLPDVDLLGVDISKEAIRLASKQAKTGFAVAGVDSLPVFDHSLDGVLNMFAPIAEEEYLRVLKNDGIVIYVQVNERHLYELKEALYPQVYLNQINYFSDRFRLKESRECAFEIECNQKELWDLFQMTPYYYHTPQAGKEKLKELDHLRIHCDFVIQIYEKSVSA